MGSTSLSPNSELGSHHGPKKIKYVTERRMEKRPEKVKQWRPDLNLERLEYH